MPPPRAKRLEPDNCCKDYQDPCIKTPDEYHHYEFESLIAAVRVAIRNAGLKLLDAYRLFDLNHDGLLDCSEIYSGLLWAGMKDMKPDMVTSLVKHIDKTKDGRVRYRDFLIALNDPNELEEFVPEQVLGLLVSPSNTANANLLVFNVD